jgi:hypothetical protein
MILNNSFAMFPERKVLRQERNLHSWEFLWMEFERSWFFLFVFKYSFGTVWIWFKTSLGNHWKAFRAASHHGTQ